MYMQVETRSSSCLHLKRAPGVRSWSLLVGKAVGSAGHEALPPSAAYGAALAPGSRRPPALQRVPVPGRCCAGRGRAARVSGSLAQCPRGVHVCPSRLWLPVGSVLWPLRHRVSGARLAGFAPCCGAARVTPHQDSLLRPLRGPRGSCPVNTELQVPCRGEGPRGPSWKPLALFTGILSIGLAAAYYSGDSLGWKLFYVTGCLLVAVQNLEDWEEAIFNKNTGQVILKTFSLYRKLLTLLRAGHDQVVVLLNDIRDVNVEEEKVRYFGKGYTVVLRFATGFSHPLTQSAVMGHRSDVEAIAKLITSFLELHHLENPSELSESSDSEADGPGSQS